MIHRIVTMTFRKDEIDAFIEVFDSSKVHIRNFPGCLGLKLLQTTNKPYQISTLSLWENEEALMPTEIQNCFLIHGLRPRFYSQKRQLHFQITRSAPSINPTIFQDLEYYWGRMCF